MMMKYSPLNEALHIALAVFPLMEMLSWSKGIFFHSNGEKGMNGYCSGIDS
jgi:hypothetical protein